MIPYPTTTITVTRPPQVTEETPDADRDRWERDDEGTPLVDEGAAPAPDVVVTDWPAAIDRVQGESGTPGDTQTLRFTLACDPMDLRHVDSVTDDDTGIVYAVVWATTTPDVGDLGHTRAELRAVTGFGFPATGATP